MFDFFKKKKEPEYDITNLTSRDLDKGFVFDYDLKSWVVKEVYEYDWGNNNFARECKIDSGDDVAFLYIEEDGELELSLSRPLKIRKIEEDVFEEITEKEKAPRTIHYDNKPFYLNEDSAGYFRDCSKETEDWEEFITWQYYDEDEEHFISLTQWDERTIEASVGISLEPHHISNILPGES